MTSRLTVALRRAPATVPGLAAVVLFSVWATSQAGYPVTHWAPGALILMALLGIALGIVGLSLAQIPVSVRVALVALAAYTALSYLSILWAAVPADAWEGANRTLLYLIVFALFACWPQRGGTAALLLGSWTVALICLAAFTALHVDGASARALQSEIPGGRLVYPTGYPNANAAQWLMAFWPAVLLARSDRLHPALRGLLAGGAVMLADVALLSQSRGSLYALPVMLVLVFALLPGRTRTFVLLVPIALAIGVGAPTVLAVGDQLRGGEVAASTVHAATAVMFAASGGVGLLVALGATLEARHAFSDRSIGRLRTAVRAAGLVALALALALVLVFAGNPVDRARSAWESFKGGYASNAATGSRLVSGLGSNRYDFYRVALDEFAAHPLLGIGADNFQQQYLARGRSDETPRYPHSVELRTLSQTGIVGALLGVVGLAAALLAAARALRTPDRLARDVAAAALAGFGYWLVHGSFDWFWEFAGLGAPAFAMLGLAGALAPRQPSQGADAAARSPRLAGATAAVIVCIALALAASFSLALPWLSQLEIQSAAKIWATSPQTAYARLRVGAGLNPLSDEPYLLAGSIALRYGDLARAESEFRSALSRVPSDAYATLELAAIASARAEHQAALTLLERTVRLEPRDELARRALDLVREGRRVTPAELNRQILIKARQL